MNAAAIVQLLNVVDGLLTFISARGVTKERVLLMLQQAEAEGRDITTSEVQAELDQLSLELGATQDQIDEM
jgi:hypothetical protein